MPLSIDEPRLRDLLRPYVGDEMLSPEQLISIRRYAELINRWNERMNLTAVRTLEGIVERQIGESLFAAPFTAGATTLLDFGSGAGLPGIPLAIANPVLEVTLAESQGKKASFLREAGRTLGLPITVWPHRVEKLPEEQVFDLVTMRAVDDSAHMLPFAAARVGPGGRLLRYVGASTAVEIPQWAVLETYPVPNSMGLLQILTRA